MERHIVMKLPKVDLHCHLDGSVPLETLKKLAIREGINPDCMAKAIVKEDCQSLKDYLSCFDEILPVLQTKENLYEATFATIEEIAKENVQYLELRFAPLLHCQKGLSVREVLLAVSQAVYDAMKSFDIQVNLLICAMRHHENEINLELLETLKTIGESYIVGFDFAGDEAAFNNQKISPVVKEAKKNGMQITLHSGECGCPHEVVEAVKLGATRIGHGIAIKDNADALDMCVANNVLLEMCPTSNVQTQAVKSLEEYPLTDFINRGVICSVNTDNRTVSNTTLTDEYMLLHQYLNINYRDMKKLNINAISHSFAAAEVKKNIYNNIVVAFEPLIACK